MTLNLAKSPVLIRTDLQEALNTAWLRLGLPGTWWTGRERLDIVAEARNAITGPFCRQCKQALSPFSEDGEHEHLERLPGPLIDAIHRVMNDSARLTPSWYERTIESGLSEPAYVEAVAVVVTAVVVDTFHRGMGLPLPELPPAQPGDASHLLPAGARKRFSWVPTVSPKDAGEALKNVWWPDGNEHYVPRIHQALSLVVEEVIAFRNLSETLYLPSGAMMDFASNYRAISRPQVELLAARISALNECFY